MNGAPPGADVIDLAEQRRRRAPPSPLRGRFIVTATLTAACVVLFLLRYVWPDGGEHDHLMRMGANYGPHVKSGQVYRLLASAFLHADPLHLIMNTIALWSFGPVLEALFGPRRYLVLYAASALMGSVASAFFTDPRMSVGASGAVWGLMTAGIAIVYRPQGLLPEGALAAARQRAWAPLAINLMYSFKPGVDLLAHLGGGVVGAALVLSGALTRGVPPLSAPPSERRDPLLWHLAAGVTAVAMAASVAGGFLKGEPWESGKPPELVRTAIGDTGVTMALPRETASRHKIETEGGEPSHLYGAVTDDPLLIEVDVHPLDAPIPPEAEELELSSIVEDLAKNPDPKVTEVTAPHLVTVGGRRAVHVDVKLKNDVPVKSYFFLAGARLVALRTYGVGDRPKSWADIEDKIIASVEPR